MTQQDTIELLKECNSGSKMAVDAINRVFDKTDSALLRALLEETRRRHTALGENVHALLTSYGEREEDPPLMAKTMANINIELKLAVCPTDHEIASLLIDGCNTGLKSLTELLNQYAGANEEAKQLARALLRAEETLMRDLRDFL
ncbi:MAG: hypothetical protein RSF90_04170 [Pygmaiobacter sp.]